MILQPISSARFPRLVGKDLLSCDSGLLVSLQFRVVVYFRNLEIDLAQWPDETNRNTQAPARQRQWRRHWHDRMHTFWGVYSVVRRTPYVGSLDSDLGYKLFRASAYISAILDATASKADGDGGIFFTSHYPRYVVARIVLASRAWHYVHIHLTSQQDSMYICSYPLDSSTRW